MSGRQTVSVQIWTIPGLFEIEFYGVEESNRRDRLDSEAYLSRNATGARIPRVMHNFLCAEHQRSRSPLSNGNTIDVNDIGSCHLATSNHPIMDYQVL